MITVTDLVSAWKQYMFSLGIIAAAIKAAENLHTNAYRLFQLWLNIDTSLRLFYF